MKALFLEFFPKLLTNGEKKFTIEKALWNDMVDVAQLVRALVCGTRGRGFESHLPPHNFIHWAVAKR